ncbi:cyanovirin-N family protein [Trichoderma guizhouense]|uniref:Cyanovirin-N family protein n=1 Tax=Trichoderma guizhouense TaxID=1491466 RepID=A0A1T3D090_9HYPO|nr:cyanovirin-N family protein [Trichoderma guizhouense]
MSFFESSQNVRLEGSCLIADVACEDGSWTESVLDLNNHVGNNEGFFEIGGNGVFDSADQVSWRLDGTTIITLLYRSDGSFGEEQFLDLNQYVSNENGVLVFNY